MSGLLSHRMLVVLLIGVLAAAGDAYAQTTWYVDEDAPSDPNAGDPTISDPNEDGSADHPYDAIQEGIDPAVDGDTVLVLDGTYTGEGNRDLDFGGRLITVRSANGAASCVIDCHDAGRGFYFHNGETAAAVVEGFTITNGRASGGGMRNYYTSPTVTQCTFSGNTAGGGGMHNSANSSPMVTQCSFSGNTAGEHGGGMYNLNSSPTVTDCTFSGNGADWDGGGMRNSNSSPTVTDCTFSANTADDSGGGMGNWYSSSPTVTQCTFSANTADYGGGMWNYESSPKVTDCTFSNNSADYWKGGGMCNWYNSSPKVTNCTFRGNTADYGGGMHNYDSSSPTVTDCTFSGNTAHRGGGMYNYYNSSPTVTQCTFSGNTAGAGGGMYNSASSPTVTDCIVTSNSGAGGGGMYNYNNSTPTVTQCTFSNNSADSYGGGMYNDESSPTVTQCTFSGNTAYYYGGGMYNDSSSPTVANCILWNDTGGEIRDDFSTPLVTYSDVQGGYVGTGNINADPMFVDAGSGDYHLSPGSPCVNAGDNAAAVVFSDTTTDAGTQTSVIVADPGRYAIDDEIEYDGDGVLRTVTGVDPNSGQVSFDDPLAAPSGPNAPIANYGWGDMDGDDRILGYTVDMGADEYVPAQLLATEPAADGSLPKTQSNLILCVFDRSITLPASGNPLVVKDMTNDCTDVSNLFTYSIDADDPNGCTLEGRETDPNDPNNHDVLPDMTWYQVESAPGWTDVVPFQFEVYTLVGDCEGGGRVSTLDYVCVKGALGGRGDMREDLDGNGRVTTGDYLVVRNNLGPRAPSKPALCP